MPFQLHVSNSLNQLAQKLCADLRSEHKDVFQPSYIITQTEGMNNWLKLQMAEKIGIAANCRYLKPNDFINTIYYLLGGSSVQSLSAENLNWLLFKLLDDEEFVKKYPSISSYYHHEGPDKFLKRMGLAEKVADLFDQYQVYRPDMIQQWNKDMHGKKDDDDWQKDLWLSAKEITGDNFPDKTLLGKFIESALQYPAQAERLKQKMPVVYLFGISLVTEYHLQVFQHLANHIDIHFLILNPAPGIYWFEDKTEKQLAFLKRKGILENSETSIANPLLLGWGKIIQDTFSLLFKNDEIINAYEAIEVRAPSHDTLLHKIQYAIFQNEMINEEDLFSQDEVQDGSIIINSCYSPAREVEVLYNYLVHLIDKKEERLSSRDIVVMVSDIDLYASYIKAIFDNAPYQFNYTIADESYSTSDSISNALHAILSVTEQAFTAEQVIRLLDSSHIREKFGLADLSLIRHVVDEANIRFGMEGNKLDESVYVSWKYGLKRIMYGICMSGSGEYGLDDESFFPLDIVEGNAAHEVIRFVHFVTMLMVSLEERKQAKTIDGWVEYVDMVLHNFICNPEETTDEDYLLLLSQLENYNSYSELFTEAISYEVFMHSFLSTLSGASRRNLFAGGGITFCSLIPMRSIPFKVVGLLGLDLEKFPRKEKKLSFNLMEKEKRKGDRNVKENDKHLFLETLLSAGDYLYISFIGRSVKDNSSIPPSSLVDELVDFISSAAVEPAKVHDQLITLQPLHGFSQKYAQNDPRLYSYLGKTVLANQNLQHNKTIEKPGFEEVFLQALIGFFKNPFKGYYNKVLGIYYGNEDIGMTDTELFELDKLQEWGLKNQLLPINNDEERKLLKNRLVKTGALPLKNMADVELQKIGSAIIPVKGMFDKLIGNAEERKLPVDIMIGDTRLQGNVKGVYDNKIVVVSWSKRENKYLLDAYIRYLAVRAAGHEVELYFISFIKEGVFEATEISQPVAMQELKVLLELYKQGHDRILPFDPGFDINPVDIENLDEHGFEKALKKTFENFNFPCFDDYMNQEYNSGFFNTDNIVNEYKAVASKVLAPIVKLFPGYFQ